LCCGPAGLRAALLLLLLRAPASHMRSGQRPPPRRARSILNWSPLNYLLGISTKYGCITVSSRP
jgi:hypothetical protein